MIKQPYCDLLAGYTSTCGHQLFFCRDPFSCADRYVVIKGKNASLRFPSPVPPADTSSLPVGFQLSKVEAYNSFFPAEEAALAAALAFEAALDALLLASLAALATDLEAWLAMLAPDFEAWLAALVPDLEAMEDDLEAAMLAEEEKLEADARATDDAELKLFLASSEARPIWLRARS